MLSPYLHLTDEIHKTPMNLPYSRVANGVAISLYETQELLEGRDHGSGHHLITYFLNEQSGLLSRCGRTQRLNSVYSIS